jgi:hypothetical protein
MPRWAIERHFNRYCDSFENMGTIQAGFSRKSIYRDELWGSITIELKIDYGCKFGYSREQCTKYLSTTLDSCDCGRSKKHGGRVSTNCLSWMIDVSVSEL